MLPLLPVIILHVNLTSKEIRVEEFNDTDVIKKFCGGRGLATYLYLTRYDLALDAFDERQPIICYWRSDRHNASLLREDLCYI